MKRTLVVFTAILVAMTLLTPGCGGRASRRDPPAATLIRIASWLGAKTLLTIPGAVEVFFLPERPICM